MTSDEEYIKSRFGNECHFRVPENYFDSVAHDIMSRSVGCTASVPLKTGGVALGARMPVRRVMGYAAAACLAMAVAGGAIVLSHGWSGGGNVGDMAARNAHDAVETTHLTSDQLADYSMLDNDQIYSLLANN